MRGGTLKAWVRSVPGALGYLGVGLLLLGSAWAQLRQGDPIVRVVGTDRVRVRTAPMFQKDGKDTFIRWMARGTRMKRIGKRGNWYQVVLPDGRMAWISSRYVEEGTARDLLEVRPSRANVRKSATETSDKIGTVARGDMLHLDRKRNNWYLAILPDGRRGWIREDLVIHRPVDPPAPQEKPEPRVDFYRQGLDYAAEQRIDEAIEAFQQALAAHPEDGAAHFELAKLLKGKGDEREALGHFQKALRGKRPRMEAKRYIDAILKARADSLVQAGEANAEALTAPAHRMWVESLFKDTTYLLPGLAVGSLVFLIGLGLVYRRRRASRMDRPVYRRRKPDVGFDSVLKYAVEKRPLLRSIEEAEQKQAEVDEAFQKRFETFGREGPRLPAVESTEALLKRVEDLRQTILNQEERAQVYADLVVLQNEKIDALDEEIKALKKLVQLDYRDSRKEKKQEK